MGYHSWGCKESDATEQLILLLLKILKIRTREDSSTGGEKRHQIFKYYSYKLRNTIVTSKYHHHQIFTKTNTSKQMNLQANPK